MLSMTTRAIPKVTNLYARGNRRSTNLNGMVEALDRADQSSGRLRSSRTRERKKTKQKVVFCTLDSAEK
jgi:hypothetical protein